MVQISEIDYTDETAGRTAMISKSARGWMVYSSDGKPMGGPYKSRAEAQRRLAQIEMFKHMKQKGQVRNG